MPWLRNLNTSVECSRDIRSEYFADAPVAMAVTTIKVLINIQATETT